MKIDNEIKLDFDDVLLQPQRTTLKSRKDVKLERTFEFYHSKQQWTGIPIMCSNMSFASFNLARALAEHQIITCLHKYHTIEELTNFFEKYPGSTDYIWVSIGYNDDDFEKIKSLKRFSINICIDVPNAHMDDFVNYCKKLRQYFFDSIIMAGNVADPSSTQELIIHGGVDIVKVGIGPGCFIAGTKVKTKNKNKNIEKIEIGDLVLTHTGQYRKVVGTTTKEENHRIIDINGIKCTENHRFYVVHKKYKNKINNSNIHKYAKWVSASDLNDDWFLIKIQE